MSDAGDGKQSKKAYIAAIQSLALEIPAGQVATYGQLSFVVGAGSARIAGTAMARLPNGSKVPWHRVVNSQGKLAIRKEGGPSAEQARRLRDEGVFLDSLGRIDFAEHAWPGPSWRWLEEKGYEIDELVLRSEALKRQGPWVHWRF